MKLTATDYKKMKYRKRLKSEVRYKVYLKFLSDHCNAPVIYNENIRVNGKYVPRFKPYYSRRYRGKHKYNRYCWGKMYANRAVRNYSEEIHKGAAYKRIFDYWWID